VMDARTPEEAVSLVLMTLDAGGST
jgi:hypothetical protein